ncbi:hypothetical protein CSQ88_22295 [Iodobacter sp. BJB302]|nr:hypothetical protein CSQ88_22295 [Iodobacter sp. BJB302]
MKIAGKVVNIRTDKDGKYIVKRDYSTEGFSKRFFSVLGSSPFSKQLSQRLNFDYSQKSEPVNFGGTPNVVAKIFNNALFGAEEDRRSVSCYLPRNAERVSLDSFAGQLNGRLYKTGNPEDKKTVVFIHGSDSSAEAQSSDLATTYNQNGYNVLAVNMRGYGKSDGVPSEKGMYSDAQVMFDYVHKTLGVPEGDILIHGYSLGGPVAANLYKHLELSGLKTAGLILDRPMPSMRSAIVAHEMLNPIGLVGLISSSINGKFDVQENLKGIDVSANIMLITDNEGLGAEGEKMRLALAKSGINTVGSSVCGDHQDTMEAMKTIFNENNKEFFSASI